MPSKRAEGASKVGAGTSGSAMAQRRAERRGAERRNSDERWLAILEAGSRVFRKFGYASATLEDVAKEVGINRATLYYYVADKSELLVAILGIARDPDGAYDLAVEAADLQAAALGKNLLVGRAHEMAHEDRPFFGTDAYQLGGAAERERRIGFAERHLEADH